MSISLRSRMAPMICITPIAAAHVAMKNNSTKAVTPGQSKVSSQQRHREARRSSATNAAPLRDFHNNPPFIVATSNRTPSVHGAAVSSARLNRRTPDRCRDRSYHRPTSLLRDVASTLYGPVLKLSRNFADQNLGNCDC